MSSNVMFEGDHVSNSIDEALSASENRGAKKGRDHFINRARLQALSALYPSVPLGHFPRVVRAGENALGHLELPGCPNCRITMRWFRSELVRDTPESIIAHLFVCPNCRRAQRDRYNARRCRFAVQKWAPSFPCDRRGTLRSPP